MGNTLVRGHRQQSPAFHSAERVFDSPRALVKPTELEGPKVQVPLPVGDLLEADVFLLQHVTHVDPVRLPPDPAVATHAPDLEVARVLERWEASGIAPSRRLVAGG